MTCEAVPGLRQTGRGVMNASTVRLSKLSRTCRGTRHLTPAIHQSQDDHSGVSMLVDGHIPAVTDVICGMYGCGCSAAHFEQVTKPFEFKPAPVPEAVEKEEEKRRRPRRQKSKPKSKAKKFH